MPKPSQKSKKLLWSKEYDIRGHAFWEALFPFSSDGESADIYWRISRVLQKTPIKGAKKLYFANSDFECPHVPIKGTLPQVKAAIQQKHDEILDYYAQEKEVKVEK